MNKEKVYQAIRDVEWGDDPRGEVELYHDAAKHDGQEEASP